MNQVMKSYLKILLAVLLLTVCTGAIAQSKLTDEQKQAIKARYEANKQQLNLTDDQSKKVDAINTTFFEGLFEIKNSSDSKLSKYRKFKSISSDRDKKMKAVLNKDQYKTYKAQQEAMKDDFKERRANRE
jgi:hypothetical protein